MLETFARLDTIERGRQTVVDTVLSSVCSAIDRAMDRRGNLSLASPKAQAKAQWYRAKRDAKIAAGTVVTTTEGWRRIDPVKSEYVHLGDQRVVVRGVGSEKYKTWSYRFSADDGDGWRGEFPTRGDALTAGRQDLEARDAR
jgi:hypothetical protein